MNRHFFALRLMMSAIILHLQWFTRSLHGRIFPTVPGNVTLFARVGHLTGLQKIALDVDYHPLIIFSRQFFFHLGSSAAALEARSCSDADPTPIKGVERRERRRIQSSAVLPIQFGNLRMLSREFVVNNRIGFRPAETTGTRATNFVSLALASLT
jgi:hypothetical protein